MPALEIVAAQPPGRPQTLVDRVRPSVAAPDVRVAVATSWQGTVELFGLAADRHVYVVDELAHHRLAAWQSERVAASLSYDLPTDFVCLGAWVGEAIGELRPDARRATLRPGTDKAVFGPAAGRRTGGAGPLRVAVDDGWLLAGLPSAAREAVAAMAEPHAVVDASGTDPRARAEALRDADVLLMLDPVAGVLGSPLEAMHAGVAPVVLASGGQAELVRHLANGAVCDHDDVRGVARTLDLLARDRGLLSTLQAAALTTAARWPSLDAAAAELRTALERFAAEPPPDAVRWPERLMADAMAAVATFEQDHHELAGYVRRLEADAGYQAAQRLRARLADPRLAPVRRALARARRG